VGAGILLLDKPVGLSSNGALQRVRRILGAQKAGHVGSLDPLATGMLPICLGEATKIAGDILAGRKLYRFTVSLGARTATGDAEGDIVETLPVPAFDGPQLESVLQRFRGRQSQIPPMYSALKRAGQPLYKLARAGIEVERAPRNIDIYELRAPAGVGHQGAPALIELETLCSKGTYVRTLAEDLARALGTCGHVRSLRRIYVEPFNDAPMETLETIDEARATGAQPALLAADSALQHLAAVQLDMPSAAKIRHGQSVTVADVGSPGRVRLYDTNSVFMGLGELDTLGVVRPKRLFVS
jgi:tRNA pseudouridine55 synthase